MGLEILHFVSHGFTDF